MLQVEGLTVYYQTLKGEVHALEDVSFSVKEGEILGIAGESGCGKTTLGSSLVLLKPPMKYIRGRVILDGETLPIWDTEAMDRFRMRHVSIIPQYAMNALNPVRKVGDLIADLLKAKGFNVADFLPEVRRRFDLVRLPHDVLNLYPFELSGGMRQRVVMILSTLLNPKLLIADEITSALDVATQKLVLELLVQLRERGYARSILFISHDLSVLSQIADSLMIMYAGQVVEKGPIDALITNPRHPYTKMLIASLPKVGERFSEQRLRGIPGQPPQLINPPQGCRFRERCPVAVPQCESVPPITQVKSEHTVLCWHEVAHA